MERLADYSKNAVPAKSLAALEIVGEIAESGGKVVCWSNFVANLDQFADLVRSRLRLPVFQIDGRVPAGNDALHADADSSTDAPGEGDTRELVIHKFLHLAGPAVLVTNPASTSESVSLHRSRHNAIYLDRTYDCANGSSVNRPHSPTRARPSC